uniref:Uncharacterized protein n=1 Tax=Rhizophora mucronata TaxID=61149 RepID=A0A2P2JT69_RHIMU
MTRRKDWVVSAELPLGLGMGLQHQSSEIFV